MRWKGYHEYTVRIWKAMVAADMEFMCLNSSGQLLAKSDKNLYSGKVVLHIGTQGWVDVPGHLTLLK
jgi:hypothetical protein